MTRKNRGTQRQAGPFAVCAAAGRPHREADAKPGGPEAPRRAAAVERLAYRLEDIVKATGLPRRTLERERAAGRFPGPDRIVGRRVPLWRAETVERWLKGGAG